MFLPAGRFFRPRDRIMCSTFEPSSPNDIIHETDLGQNPIDLYFESDSDTRANILLNHPQVIGFVYFNEGSVTKAFLPKRIIDWTSSRKIIAAVSGSPDDFVPFSVTESDLCSNNLFLCDLVKFDEKVKSKAVGQYFKHKRKQLEVVPECASTDAKAKNLHVISFPSILPLVKGFSFEEGSCRDDLIQQEFEKVHDLYEDLWFLRTKAHPLDQKLITNDPKCPFPATHDIVFWTELPLKVLIRHRNVPNNAYAIMREEVDRFQARYNPKPCATEQVLQEIVAPNEALTVVTSASSALESKTIDKNERLITFMSLFFPRPQYDREGQMVTLLPAELSDEALDMLTSSTSTSDQATQLGDGLTSLADEITNERFYLSRTVKFPYLSQTVLLYIIKTIFHQGSIDKNVESIKKSFNVLALLPPPTKASDEYDRYINSSKNHELEEALEQPSEKRSAVKKEIFVKGKQESLQDVITFIANFVTFARYWVKMSDEMTTQPTIIQMIIEIADFLSTSDYERFHESHMKSKPYMPHTLIAYVFNITSIFVKLAKNRKNVCLLTVS